MASAVIVDTEPGALDVMQATLVRARWEVIAVQNPKDALVAVESASPDLLISEVALPGMDGMELVQRVREVSPFTAALLVSGYTSEPLNPTVPFLAKPFTCHVLLQRVREVIAQSRQVAERACELSEQRERLIAIARARAGALETAIADSRRSRASSVQRREKWQGRFDV